MKAPPADVTGVDATGNVALDSALARISTLRYTTSPGRALRTS